MACRLNVIVDMNSFSQMSHLNGFTPVCRPMWDCSSSWVRNVLSHSTHLKGLSPVCTACRTNNGSNWISISPVSSSKCSNEGNVGGTSVGTGYSDQVTCEDMHVLRTSFSSWLNNFPCLKPQYADRFSSGNFFRYWRQLSFFKIKGR